MSEVADTDGLLQQALSDAAHRPPDGGAVLEAFRSTCHALTWIQVIAAPHAFGALDRVPPARHLIRMVDDFLAYVRRGDRDTTPTFEPVPYELREERGLHLRRLLEGWKPPDLTAEILEAARQLLEAEGLRPPGGWDNLSLPPGNIRDCLHWPGDAE